jgi:hypothetical protein
MPFEAPFKRYEKNTNYKRNEFLELAIGKNTVRFLNETATIHQVHYLTANKLMLKCLGQAGCPICKRNHEMFVQYGKEAPKTPGFISQSQYAYVNVFDRTPVKICPKAECQKEVKAGNIQNKFPAICPKCGTSLVSVPVTPLNKVKIFNFGTRLNDQIIAEEIGTLSAEGEPLGILNFDLDIMVLADSKSVRAGVGRDTLEVPEDSLFDLDNAVQGFSAEEIGNILKGVTVRDIYNSRKTSTSTEAAVSPEEQADMKKEIDSLFMK